MLPGFSILRLDTIDMEGEEGCQPADFALEPFLGKAEWVLDIEEKHFCLFFPSSEPLPTVQLFLFYFILFCFFFFLSQYMV